MKRLRMWWTLIRNAIYNDVDAHIGRLTGDATYQPLRAHLREELPQIIAELENTIQRLKTLM